mmetsp:Transcript_21446/g.64127  ORF Transcript_21446/g.64127 Transcript_21446/m.64127 type:complete len:169 (+) Transcript_21446:78-584(+)
MSEYHDSPASLPISIHGHTRPRGQSWHGEAAPDRLGGRRCPPKPVFGSMPVPSTMAIPPLRLGESQSDAAALGPSSASFTDAPAGLLARMSVEGRRPRSILDHLEAQGLRKGVSAIFEDGSEKTASLELDEDLDGDLLREGSFSSEVPTLATWTTSASEGIFGRLEGV